MSEKEERNNDWNHALSIVAVGIGDAGWNAVHEMTNAGMDEIKYVCPGTGISVGSVSDFTCGADMVFVISDAANYGKAENVARIAKESNSLTIGIVTQPFAAEREGIFDTLFAVSEEAIGMAIRSIYAIACCEGLIGWDFEDVKWILKDAGVAHVGIGKANGKGGCTEALKCALADPNLGDAPGKAEKHLMVFFGELSLLDVQEAVWFWQKQEGDGMNGFVQAVFSETMKDEVAAVFIAIG